MARSPRTNNPHHCVGIIIPSSLYLHFSQWELWAPPCILSGHFYLSFSQSSCSLSPIVISSCRYVPPNCQSLSCFRKLVLALCSYLWQSHSFLRHPVVPSFRCTAYHHCLHLFNLLLFWCIPSTSRWHFSIAESLNHKIGELDTFTCVAPIVILFISHLAPAWHASAPEGPPPVVYSTEKSELADEYLQGAWKGMADTDASPVAMILLFVSVVLVVFLFAFLRLVTVASSNSSNGRYFAAMCPWSMVKRILCTCLTFRGCCHCLYWCVSTRCCD